MTAPQDTAPHRAFWLKTLHQWHWVSAALCLLGMLLFSLTGITLNHAGQIESQPQVVHRQGKLTNDLQAALSASRPLPEVAGHASLPAEVRQWLSLQWGIDPGSRAAEWTADEIYLSMPRPGGAAWVRIDRASGEVEYERTDRGWVSYFNDLHKGRHTGSAWSWFIDLFAVACLVFSVTGLFMMKLHAARRPTTWPLVGLGVVIPLLLALLLVH